MSNFGKKRNILRGIGLGIANLFTCGLALIVYVVYSAIRKKSHVVYLTIVGIAVITQFLVFAGMIIIAILNPLPTAETTLSYDIRSLEQTYTVAEVPEIPAIAEKVEYPSYTLEGPGLYVIGENISDYTTGLEKEFTTGVGNYTVGEDFQPGIYDISVVSGSGNVMGCGLNEIMGNQGNMYSSSYKNAIFETGCILETDAELKLTPKTAKNSDKLVEPGKYNISVVSGSGNVMGCGLNTIMGSQGGMYKPTFDNANLTKGCELSTDATIKLESKDPIVTKPATPAVPAIPAYNVVEKVVKTLDEDVCYIDDVVASCDTLKNYGQISTDFEVNSTIDSSISETLRIVGSTESCKIDEVEAECTELKQYDDLKRVTIPEE